MNYVGYAKLRPGRIHLFCPRCKRKLSNVPRMTGPVPDPERAVLCHVLCERCSQGGKDSDMSFLDARGRDVCGFCGRHCERAGGRARCDERLINARVVAWARGEK